MWSRQKENPDLRNLLEESPKAMSWLWSRMEANRAPSESRERGQMLVLLAREKTGGHGPVSGGGQGETERGCDVAETVMVGRVVDGDSWLTTGYVMPVGGGQWESLLLVGVHESETSAYRRVMRVAAVMRAAQEESEREEAAREESDNG